MDINIYYLEQSRQTQRTGWIIYTTDFNNQCRAKIIKTV